MTDKEFLTWIHDRMLYVHGENENFDYMHRLRKIIASDEPTKESNPALGTLIVLAFNLIFWGAIYLAFHQ